MANSTSNTQITIAIPAGIEPPKFKLFDRVRVRNQNSYCNCKRTGIVSGMNYVSFRRALREKEQQGWEYTVDFLEGVSEAEALEVTVSFDVFCESDLEMDES